MRTGKAIPPDLHPLGQSVQLVPPVPNHLEKKRHPASERAGTTREIAAGLATAGEARGRPASHAEGTLLRSGTATSATGTTLADPRRGSTALGKRGRTPQRDREF